MNGILTFLDQNRQRLNLAAYGIQGRLSCLVITPRFRASSHVVLLVSSEAGSAPALVAKIPRLKDATASIRQEAANLQTVQSLRAGGFNSIPRLVAFEEYFGYPILLETALVGQPMDPMMVRRNLTLCCPAMVEWLVSMAWSGDNRQERANLGRLAAVDGSMYDNWFARLIEEPLRYFAARFPLSPEEAGLLAKTETLLAPLRTMCLPLVFAHGDLSHPNLLWLESNEPGVIDWELAEPYGLPAYDLFVFLTYVAFAMGKAQRTSQHLAAFQSAFWGKRAWTQPSIESYAKGLGLPVSVLNPLFVVTWLRYTVGLLVRLGHAGSGEGRFGQETAAWLRQNRYYALWRYAVTHADELSWG